MIRPPSPTFSPLLEASARLRDAALTTVPCAPVRDLLGTELDAAYETQELIIRSRESADNPRVGRKVGLTAPAVQRQLGVDQPDFGVLLADMEIAEDALIPHDTLLQPRIEAEIAFVMARDVTDTDRASVMASVSYVVPALEIVDSRVAAWDISIVDTVADNASSAYYVLGAARLPLADYSPIDATMSMSIDGEVVSTGSGAACLGDPVNALVWVAETAARLGRPLRAGEIVLSGALGPMVPLLPGARVEATISGLGSVSATASASA
ncbi:fumarylacetoacetate hydrolase family protein [Salinibacterium sp. ZJ454]|uniref:2-keto-4-pentenoate hydratase n=1 Tax=Salinibacterium sp. ZJ454 TaxID=2708339 RepID=UPI001421F6E0|nr:fumarylacetoacetate hydrolase family protein [Salinibacterium sp. ZJ454]